MCVCVCVHCIATVDKYDNAVVPMPFCHAALLFFLIKSSPPMRCDKINTSSYGWYNLARGFVYCNGSSLGEIFQGLLWGVCVYGSG